MACQLYVAFLVAVVLAVAAHAIHFEHDAHNTSKQLGLFMATRFASPTCKGAPVGIDSGATSSCSGNEFVSCTKDTCVVQNYNRKGCLGHTGSKVFQHSVCTPDGAGGAVVYNHVPQLMGDSSHHRCPLKDVHAKTCGNDVLACLGNCTSVDPCVKCLIHTVVKNGDVKKCCSV